MLVEPLHPVRQPSDAGLEESNSQFREQVEHTSADQCAYCAHDLERIGRRMLQEQIIAHFKGAQTVGRPRRAAMEARGQVLVLASLPDRMERRMIEQFVLDVSG